MRRKNNKGFSLVELAIGLAVITVLILAVSMSSGIRDTARQQSAVDSVQALRSASESYLASGKLNYASVSFTELKNGNFLPANFNASGTNPWGGNFTLGVNSSNNTRVDITLTSVASADNTKLTTFFNNIALNTSYDTTGKTWTATF